MAQPVETTTILNTQAGERKQTDGQTDRRTDKWTDKRTDGHYQTYYLPCFAADDKTNWITSNADAGGKNVAQLLVSSVSIMLDITTDQVAPKTRTAQNKNISLDGGYFPTFPFPRKFTVSFPDLWPYTLQALISSQVTPVTQFVSLSPHAYGSCWK